MKILKETVDLQTGTGKHVPRAVFIDLEPSVIDETRQRLSVDASGRQALTIVDPQAFLEH